MAGIECEFVEKPPKAFQSECPICLLVLREPYQATCCGKSFCKECIEGIKVPNSIWHCPTCKTDNFFSYPNKGLQQSLNDFEVYCSHKSKGCEWRGELRELDKHLNSDPPADKSLEGCPFTVISCPLSHTGCEVKLPRRDVKIHVNDDLLSHLMRQTALVLTLSTQLQTLNTQLQTVSVELDSVKGEKQQLKQNVTELKRKIEKLEEAQQLAFNTGHPIGPVKIIMSNFKQHQDETAWYSPPFYTHPRGYKMCLCVWPKGFASGRGTHISVTIHLMHGEFDDQLKWPFRGDITYQLEDQDQALHHITKIVDFTDRTPDEYAKRVTDGEMNVKGWGHSKLLPLFDLQPKYLKNDRIKFQILKVVLDLLTLSQTNS